MKKNGLDYFVLALFILCMGLALSAALEYNTRATNREFLNQGIWLLSMAGIGVLGFLGVRLVHTVAPKCKKNVGNAFFYTVCIGFFTAGLLARLWVINYIQLEPDSDFETYYRMANELIKGTMMTPEADLDRRYIALYPHTIGFPMLVLEPVFRIFGVSVRNALMANLVLSMLSVIVAGKIGKRLFGRLGCMLCVGLLSLWPSYIFYSSMVATEPAFTLLLLLAFNLMIAILDQRKGSVYDNAPWYCVAWLPVLGIVLAVAGAIRPMAIILLAAFAVALIRSPEKKDQKDLHSQAYEFLKHRWMCLVIVLIPYFVVGSMITGSITSIIAETPAGGLSASGYNMMVGLNTESDGLWNQEDADFFSRAYEETGDASKAHSECIQVAIQRIQSEPENVLNLMIYKFRDLWRTDDFGLDWNLLWAGQQNTLTPELTALIEWVRPIGRGMYMAILLFAIIGAIQMWSHVRRLEMPAFICMAFFLGTALAHMLLETQVRYHYNMIPFLIFLAVYTLNGWRKRFRDTPIIIRRAKPGTEDIMEDHTNFDMADAVMGGNIKMTVSKNYDREVDGHDNMLGNVSVKNVNVVEGKEMTLKDLKK